MGIKNIQVAEYKIICAYADENGEVRTDEFLFSKPGCELITVTNTTLPEAGTCDLVLHVGKMLATYDSYGSKNPAELDFPAGLSDEQAILDRVRGAWIKVMVQNHSTKINNIGAFETGNNMPGAQDEDLTDTSDEWFCAFVGRIFSVQVTGLHFERDFMCRAVDVHGIMLNEPAIFPHYDSQNNKERHMFAPLPAFNKEVNKHPSENMILLQDTGIMQNDKPDGYGFFYAYEPIPDSKTQLKRKKWSVYNIAQTLIGNFISDSILGHKNFLDALDCKVFLRDLTEDDLGDGSVIKNKYPTVEFRNPAQVMETIFDRQEGLLASWAYEYNPDSFATSIILNVRTQNIDASTGETIQKIYWNVDNYAKLWKDEPDINFNDNDICFNYSVQTEPGVIVTTQNLYDSFLIGWTDKELADYPGLSDLDKENTNVYTRYVLDLKDLRWNKDNTELSDFYVNTYTESQPTVAQIKLQYNSGTKTYELKTVTNDKFKKPFPQKYELLSEIPLEDHVIASTHNNLKVFKKREKDTEKNDNIKTEFKPMLFYVVSPSEMIPCNASIDSTGNEFIIRNVTLQDSSNTRVAMEDEAERKKLYITFAIGGVDGTQLQPLRDKPRGSGEIKFIEINGIKPVYIMPHTILNIENKRPIYYKLKEEAPFELVNYDLPDMIKLLNTAASYWTRSKTKVQFSFNQIVANQVPGSLKPLTGCLIEKMDIPVSKDAQNDGIKIVNPFEKYLPMELDSIITKITWTFRGGQSTSFDTDFRNFKL